MKGSTLTQELPVTKKTMLQHLEKVPFREVHLTWKSSPDEGRKGKGSRLEKVESSGGVHI